MSRVLAIVLAIILLGSFAAVGWQAKLAGKLYWRKSMVLFAALCLSVLVGLLPIGQAAPEDAISNTDIIFLVDATYSMNALDGRTHDARLADVRSDIASFANKLAGSRFGIVTFDSSSTIYLPLTATTADIDSAAATLQTRDYDTSIEDPNFTQALKDTKTYLDQVAKVDVTRQRVLVLMTDGELTGKKDTAASVKAAAASVTSSVNATLVVGYGTENGAKMPDIRTDFTGDYAQQTLTDFAQGFTNGTYGDVFSHRNGTFLQALATTTKGRYIAEQDNQLSSALQASRTAAVQAKAHSPENNALRQNILHIPLAIIILAYVCLVEIVSWQPLRRALSHRRRA